MAPRNALGKRLKEIMLDRDLSLKEVAAKINRSRRTVYNFLNGEVGDRTKRQFEKHFPELHKVA